MWIGTWSYQKPHGFPLGIENRIQFIWAIDMQAMERDKYDELDISWWPFYCYVYMLIRINLMLRIFLNTCRGEWGKMTMRPSWPTTDFSYNTSHNYKSTNAEIHCSKITYRQFTCLLSQVRLLGKIAFFTFSPKHVHRLAISN